MSTLLRQSNVCMKHSVQNSGKNSIQKRLIESFISFDQVACAQILGLANRTAEKAKPGPLELTLCFKERGHC